MVYVILFIGSAGAGKSSIIAEFGKWIKKYRNEEVKLVNLDPGALYLPYKPDFNIRNIFTIEQIIKEEKLGPNGAIIRANEMLLDNLDIIINIFKKFNCEYILVDTPGQFEIFLFKDIAIKILERFCENFRVVGLNIIDTSLTRSASELVVAELIGLILSFRLGIEISNILHKSDLKEHENIKNLLENPELLIQQIKEEKGAMADLVIPIIEQITQLKTSGKLLSTSIYKEDCFEDLYNRINEHFCACGDLS